MATRTGQYSLIKPAEDDFYDVQDFNSNMDVVDLEMGKLDRRIQNIDNTAVVTLVASNWSGTAPYAQRVAVPGIKATDKPEVHNYTPKELGVATSKLYQKMAGMITDGDTEDGYITLYCVEKRPTADFQVLLKGVSV